MNLKKHLFESVEDCVINNLLFLVLYEEYINVWWKLVGLSVIRRISESIINIVKNENKV